jgi:predicted Zn-dependent protease
VSRVAAAAALGAVVAALACSDISSPIRSDVYDWRLVATKQTGSPDTLSFQWPQSAQPVTYWVEDTLDMPARVRRALDTWQGVFLYREFRGTVVADSSAADVIVRLSAPPGNPGVPLGAMAPECSGATDLDIRPGDDTHLYLPVRVFIEPKFVVATAADSACLDLTAIHEIGHTIGIWNHSPDPNDIMYGDPIVTAPSERDRETVERIYHVAPNVTPVPRTTP